MGREEARTWCCYGNLKKKIGRPKRRWEGNIKLGWGSVEWIHLAWERDKCCEHGSEYAGCVKYGEFRDSLRVF
jgi:hypothetical protein